MRVRLVYKGGQGSGNWGHAGRPGAVGGSGPGGGSSLPNVDGLPATEASPIDGLGSDDGANQYLEEGAAEALSEFPDARTLHPSFDAEDAACTEYASREISQNSGGVATPEDARAAIVAWDTSSSTGNADSILLQERAAELFHTGKSAYIEQQIMENSGLSNIDAKVADGMLSTMYMNTQQKLSGRFENDTVTLYRGMNVDHETYNSWEVGGAVKYQSNPLSSWSSDISGAREYANGSDVVPGVRGYAVVIAQRVHISRVLSTSITGLGSFNMREFVVIGGNENDSFRVIE